MSGKADAERKPGIRIDGGNRRDLNKQRVASRLAGLPEHAPTAEDAETRRKALAARERQEKKAAAAGSDGTRLSRVKVRLSNDRATQQVMRARPGTFEWRYGRNKQDALFHAGSHLARLWEKAGISIASSANFLRGTTSGYGMGLSEGRACAIDSLEGFRTALGADGAANLVAYCVEGVTVKIIAHRNGVNEREMGTVLHHLLRVCAKHFNFM